MKKFICGLIAWSPVILAFAGNQFESFFAENGWMFFSALTIATVAAMLYWKEESHSIESICAFLVLFSGIATFYNTRTRPASFSELYEAFIYTICGLGYIRYVMKCNPNK